MIQRSSRRDFLKQTTAVSVAFWVGGAYATPKSRSSLEQINFASIGVGGKGSSDTDQAALFGKLVGLCDIDDKRLNAKANKFKDAKKYNDFREMLNELGEKIDAVTVSTPDHTHAPASIMAMEMGKHVYCQKPLTHTVHEARLMRELAAKHQLATQMGNQGTALDGFRTAIEILRSGAIGPVREVHVWTNRPFKYWKQAPDLVSRPQETPPVPDHVHWDLFLGPATERPYHPAYHPFAWRGFWDFSTGALGDMGCHTANMAFMSLKLKHPTSVSAQSGPVNLETYPAWCTVTYEFPAREDMAACKIIWYEGAKGGVRNLPSNDLVNEAKLSASGSIFVGDKGVLYSANDYGAAYKLYPEAEFKGFKEPERSLSRITVSADAPVEQNASNDVKQKYDWVQAIQGGPPAMANFDYAGLLTETILLGNVAVLAGKKLLWDGPKLKVTNMPEANKWIRKEYRSGWELA